MIAIGSKDNVYVIIVTKDGSRLIKEISRPPYITNQAISKVAQIADCYPSLDWGYGHSPIFKDRMYSILAIGWGPLVQICVLNDIYNIEYAFIDDGWLVMEDPSQDDSSLSEKSF